MRLEILLAFILASLAFPSPSHAQGCKDSELRKQVSQVSREEGVDEKELLSIIAHESSCHYYVIAWNLPKQPKTAQSKFFSSLEDAKTFGNELISTKQYRVDVGIGQINNEANIQPRNWSLDEVLDPKTALNRVAQVLKAQGWANYHSSNPVYAKKWQSLALVALDRAIAPSDSRSGSFRLSKSGISRKQSAMIVYNQASPPYETVAPSQARLVFFRDSQDVSSSQSLSWITIGSTL